MRETARMRADRLLLEGRIVITHVRPNTSVRGFARGEGTLHRFGWDGGEWWCRCPAGEHHARPNCSHVQAAKRVVAIEERTI